MTHTTQRLIEISHSKPGEKVAELTAFFGAEGMMRAVYLALTATAGEELDPVRRDALNRQADAVYRTMGECADIGEGESAIPDCIPPHGA